MTTFLTQTKVQLYRFVRIEFEDGTTKTFERRMYTGKLTHQYQIDRIVAAQKDNGSTYFNKLARQCLDYRSAGLNPKPKRLVAAWTGLRDSEPEEKDYVG